MGDSMQRNSGSLYPSYPTLSEGEPIDQFLQIGAGGVPEFFSPSLLDHDFYAPLFSTDSSPIDTNFMNSPKSQQSDPKIPPMKANSAAPTTKAPSSKAKPASNNASRKRKGSTKKNATESSKKKQALEADSDHSSDNPDGFEDLSEKDRRLLKNRKAAQQFRKRQKNHIIELEDKVDTLTGENSQLNAQLDLLAAENKLIREQLDYMRNFVLNALQFTLPGHMSMPMPWLELTKSFAGASALAQAAQNGPVVPSLPPAPAAPAPQAVAENNVTTSTTASNVTGASSTTTTTTSTSTTANTATSNSNQ